MKKPPAVATTEGFLPPQPPRKEQAMTDSTAPAQQRAPHLPSIPGMVVDAFDTASLAVAIVAAFAIKYVAAAVTK